MTQSESDSASKLRSNLAIDNGLSSSEESSAGTGGVETDSEGRFLCACGCKAIVRSVGGFSSDQCVGSYLDRSTGDVTWNLASGGSITFAGPIPTDPGGIRFHFISDGTDEGSIGGSQDLQDSPSEDSSESKGKESEHPSGNPNEDAEGVS